MRAGKMIETQTDDTTIVDGAFTSATEADATIEAAKREAEDVINDAEYD
jgi:hypothetical protein